MHSDYYPCDEEQVEEQLIEGDLDECPGSGDGSPGCGQERGDGGGRDHAGMGPKGHNKILGKRGEDAACAYLESRGIEIIARNWSCKSGEADIIALDDDILLFIEVKTRSGESRGLPEEAVTKAKRRRYEEIALAYLRSHDFSSMYVRFDVISITLIDQRHAFLRYHKNAFGGVC